MSLQQQIQKNGNLFAAIRKNGVPASIDFFISIFLQKIPKRYIIKDTNYGLSEAIFQIPLDRFERYAFVIDELKKSGNCPSILEIGSGNKGLMSFKDNLLRNFDFNIILFDINKRALLTTCKEISVNGDGTKLPFCDKSFDIVISTDVIEHISKNNRQTLFKEIMRVCKKKVLITCPLQSKDGIFAGRSSDIAFQEFYKTIHNFEEPNTAQHIKSIHSSPEEISQALPGVIIKGNSNCFIWLNYMAISSKPLLRLFGGLLYLNSWRRRNNIPPFWGASIKLELQQ